MSLPNTFPDFSDMFMGALCISGLCVLSACYCSRFINRYFRKCKGFMNINRIIPVASEEANEIDIEIPRVTFQVDATEASYSDDDSEAIPVKAYMNNEVSKIEIVNVKIIENENTEVEPFAIAKYIEPIVI